MTSSPRSLLGRSFCGHLVSSAGGALNDNFIRFAFVFTIEELGSGWAENAKPILGMAFLIPFLIFAPTAGSLGDKWPMRRIFLGVRGIELPLVVMATISLWSGSTVAMIVSLALLGLQSTVFAPSKYAAVPLIVGERRIEPANAWIQGVTTISILIGTTLPMVLDPEVRRFLGVDQVPGHTMVLCVGLGVAALGFFGALMIRPIPAQDPARPVVLPLDIRKQVGALNRDPGLWGPVAGLCGFWCLGAITQLAVVGIAIDYADCNAFGAAVFLTSLSLGILAGAALAPLLIARWCPAALPVLGALLTGTALLSFCSIASDGGATAAIPDGDRPAWKLLVEQVRPHVDLLWWLFVSGIGAGAWTVALNSLLQLRADRRRRALVYSGANVMSNLAMIGAFAAMFALATVGLDDLAILYLCGVLVVAAGAAMAVLFRIELAGWLFTFGVRLLWKVRVVGAANFPRHGGCVVIANHTSFADGPVLITHLPRAARFLVLADFFDRPISGFGLRASRCIPVRADSRHRALVESIGAAVAAAADGEVVGIFPEGKISGTGALDRFRPGVEKIAARAGVPVVPVHLDGLARDFTSKARNRDRFRLRRRVVLRIGAPLAPDATAGNMRHQIMRLAHRTALAEAARDRRTLGRAALARARRSPGRRAIADAGGELSYLQLAAAALAVKRLLGLGADEERVGVLLPPGRGGSIVNLALAFAGRTAVNLNHTAGAAGMRRMVEIAGLKTLITARKYTERIGEPEFDLRRVDVEDLLPRIGKLASLANACRVLLCPHRLLSRDRPDDVACVVFSSGSTGDPKGVQLTHRQIHANIRGVERHLQLAPGRDALLCPLPLFHSFGLIIGHWLPLVLGIPAAAHPDPTDARSLGRLAERYRPSFVVTTATFVRGWLRRIEPEQFSSLRFAVAGAERCPTELQERFRERYSAELLEGYGCTELGPVVSVNLPADLASVENEVGAKPGTVGRPLPGIEVATMDPETREELPQGERGLLVVRSPARMLGYLERDDLTEKAFVLDGYDTGDVGYVDDDGFVTITGRLARFAKVGGEMVPLDHVEERLAEELRKLEGGDDGGAPDLAVAAVPDRSKGERMVVLHTGMRTEPADLLAEAGDLPALFRPRARDFHRVDELPVLGTGKRDIKGLRALAEEVAG